MPSAEYQQRWKLFHPDKQAEYGKRYRTKNAQKLRAYSRNYNASHRKELAEKLRKWRAANPHKWREYEEKYKEQRRKHRALTKKRHPNRHNARNRVYYAVHRGELIRPTTCSNCGEVRKPQAHHHRGYEFPLDVVWLCRKCHVAEHRS